MSVPRAVRLLVVAMLATAGLVMGHLLSYVTVAPDAHERERLLAATGHGSSHLFASVGVVCAVAGVVAFVAAQASTRRSSSSVTRRSLWSTGARLWLIQSFGFVLLEGVERGHSFAEALALTGEPAFLLGLVAQVVVAAIVCGLLWLVGAAVAAIKRLLSSASVRSAPVLVPCSRVAIWAANVGRSAWNLRGPPVTV